MQSIFNRLSLPLKKLKVVFENISHFFFSILQIYFRLQIHTLNLHSKKRTQDQKTKKKTYKHESNATTIIFMSKSFIECEHKSNSTSNRTNTF